jgi:rhodanese-related sulfurtransferase
MILSVMVFAQEDDEFTLYLQDLSKQFDIEQVKSDSANLSTSVILDTRDKEEYEVSKIKNAIWVGYDDFEISKVDTIDRTREIIVYCSVGYRSSKIGIQLNEAGFKDVKNLYGGIFQWANEGRPLYKDSTTTNQIHAYNRKWGRFINNPKLVKMY